MLSNTHIDRLGDGLRVGVTSQASDLSSGWRDAVHAWAEPRYSARPRCFQARHHQHATAFDTLAPEIASIRTMVPPAEIDRGDRAPHVQYDDKWSEAKRAWRLVSRATHLDRAVPAT